MSSLNDYKGPALSITGLKKVYESGHVALKGIDLEVSQGDFFALLGPNGAGKSTTLGIVSGLVNKTEGQVKLFGLDIEGDWYSAKRLLGVVPQEFNFNQFEKVQDIVVTQAGYYGLPKKQALLQSEKYLKALDLWEKRDVPSRMLSGGMKRRLMIARALVHDPKLLILDEPTAGVDIELRLSMWQYLEKLNKELGTTIILTTHYLEEAESLCHNIAIINKGEIVKNTSKRALLQELHKQTFVVELAQAYPDQPNFDGLDIAWQDERCLEVDVEKGTAINELFTVFNDQNIQVSGIRPKSNRLETLFVDAVRK
ncbi:MAG: ABC transporter ATP-binding protein [Gammaproteobacteria bacterium]|nr:ABC transporter ATP-binding protein [Gammaproteobacteria bacterium]